MLLYKYSRDYLGKCYASTLHHLVYATVRPILAVPPPHCVIQTDVRISMIRTYTHKNFNGKYSLEQQRHLLNVINRSNAVDLLNYGLSERRSLKLLKWRDDNGKFQYLHDILRIDGFGVKIANKLLQNLLEPSRITKANSRQTPLPSPPIRGQQFVTPNFYDNYCTYMKSIVAVQIGVNIITWSRISIEDFAAENDINTHTHKKYKLSHWHFENINEKRLHLNDLVYRCLHVSQGIPTADCYVLESPHTVQPSINPGSIEQQNVNIQKAQIYAIIGYALTSRENYQLNDFDNSSAVAETALEGLSYSRNVFYMRRFLTARLFNHLVGGEKISSEQTVLDMMHNIVRNATAIRSARTQELNDIGSAQNPNNIQFPSELSHLFKCATRSQREFLGQALLLNLAFIRLVLLRDAESIKSVTRYVKKTPRG